MVEQAALELRAERKNARVAILDMFACHTFEEFLENLSREVITASSGKWQERMNNARSFFKSVAPRISIGSELEGQVSLGFDWQEARKHVGEILDLPERIAEAKKLRMVVCIDEFQNLTSFTPIDAMLAEAPKYGLAMTLPFVVAALFVRPFLRFVARHRSKFAHVEKIMGAMLVLFAVLIATNSINFIAQWMIETMPWLTAIG